MKREKRWIVPLLCWVVLNAIILSCNMPDDYMKIVSILPATAGIEEPITVSVEVSGKVDVATGTVTIDGDTRCSFLLVDGKGSCQVVFYTAGDHTISVNYSGDSNFRTENKRLQYTVVAPLTPSPSFPTTLSVYRDIGGDTAPGQAVEFTVFVSADQDIPASGTVTLTTDGETGCTATLSNGEGRCSIQFTTPGNKTVTATYPPTGQWLGSTASTTLLVNYPTEITLTLSPASPTVGQWVQASVAVFVPGGEPTPTGLVEITAGMAEGCNEFPLVDGRGSCTFFLAIAGERTVDAVFTPTDNTGAVSLDTFRDSSTYQSLTVLAALAPPPPPTQSTGGGAVGCEVYHSDTDSWICEAPCPYSPPPPHTCTP